MKDFESVKAIFDKEMVNFYHSVQNIVVGLQKCGYVYIIKQVVVHERFSEFTRDFVISYFENSEG